MTLSLLIPGVGMGGSEAATVVPQKVGVEFTRFDNRLHFARIDNRQHFTRHDDRLHFAREDEE